jgi:cell division protein FtsZ
MTTIKIIGVGGGGCSILDRIIESGLSGVDFIALDFDWQSLQSSKAPLKVQLQSTFRGLDDPGKEHRQKDLLVQKYKIQQAIGAADVVIIIAGLGGGIGSDVSPMVLNFAKEKGTLTVGIFNTPFHFEGAHRKNKAMEAVREISGYTDFLSVFSADIVLRFDDKKLGVESAFNLLDKTVAQAACNIIGFILSG